MKDVLPYHRVKYLLIPLFVVVFLQVGRPSPLWSYLGKRDFYFDFIFGLIIAGILWNYIGFTYRLLEKKLTWGLNTAKRLALQVFISCLVPILLFLFMYLGYMELYYGENFKIQKSIIYEVDLIMAALIIVIMNMVFVILNLVGKSTIEPAMQTSEVNHAAPIQEEESIARDSNKMLIANGSKYVLLDRSEIQLIKLQNGVPVAYLKDGSSSMMNTSLNALGESLPAYFFQINRNTIVNLREVKGFVAEKSGKLVLKLDLNHEEDVSVSQNRSVEFKNRLLLA